MVWKKDKSKFISKLIEKYPNIHIATASIILEELMTISEEEKKLENIKEAFDIAVGYDISIKSRKGKIPTIRSYFCVLAKRMTKNSLQEIGSAIGRDHATVMHGLKMFENAKDINDKVYLKTIKELALKVYPLINKLDDE